MKNNDNFRRGSPSPHKPTSETREKVYDFSSFGNTQAEIARYLDITPETLCKHYRKELDNATMEKNRSVAKNLYRKATEGDDITAQIFWLKTRARWKYADNETSSVSVESTLADVDARKESIKKMEKYY